MASSDHFGFGSVTIYDGDEEQVLGVGSYGKVYKARYGQLPCAAKLLHDTMFESGDQGRFKFAERFEQECQFLSRIKHPNIVQYLGTSTDYRSRRLALLMELMDESLTRFLERSTDSLPYHIQVNICHDVALALSYLHFNGIIHRDLSSNNILLIGEASRAKVTDFGMSKLMDANLRMTPLTLCPGATAYMPPEALITPPHYSNKLDCFSHGVLTIQIITKRFPEPSDANRYVEDREYPTGRLLLQIPEAERRKEHIDLIESSHPLRNLALRCIEDRDRNRPSADRICEQLAGLRREGDYEQSAEEARELVRERNTLTSRLQEQLAEKDQLLEKEKAEKDKLLEKQKAEKERQRKRERESIEKVKSYFENKGVDDAAVHEEAERVEVCLIDSIEHQPQG